MQDFEIIKSHSNLVLLMRQLNLKGRFTRWVMKLQSYTFSISHRKGGNNIVPDELSHIPEDKVDLIMELRPEVDLFSSHFKDQDYGNLKRRISSEPSKLPDVTIVDEYVYISREHVTGKLEQDENAWQLWIPDRLRKDVITRAHDTSVTAHGGIGKTLDLIRRHFFKIEQVIRARTI